MAPVPATRRRFLLAQLDRYAQNDLGNLWVAARDTDDFEGSVTEGFIQIADTYHQASGQLAATWFEQSAPKSRYIAVVAAPLAIEKLERSADWALGGEGDSGLDRLSGSLQRAVFDGARDTVALNVRKTGSRWAIEADPDCCDYCQMLASRGAVYRSEESAGAAFHDRCRCVAVEHRDDE